MGKPSLKRKLDINEASGKIKRLRTSPRKLSLVANLIKGRMVSDALIQLQFCPKRIAKDVKILLQSVIANAENNHNLDIDNLYVKEIHVGKSIVLKRFMARAKGRGVRILKPFSNIEIIVRENKE